MKNLDEIKECISETKSIPEHFHDDIINLIEQYEKGILVSDIWLVREGSRVVVKVRFVDEEKHVNAIKEYCDGPFSHNVSHHGLKAIKEKLGVVFNGNS